ncbi:hypothetical protein AB0F15_09190 [Amycolatopsis sp. NPDC026612]|uniref:hypothetical protein n=1 Tax=Amycolatopsis sp. NPDC026612 TaxID=3155466 RepID=UPI0033C847B7
MSQGNSHQPKTPKTRVKAAVLAMTAIGAIVIHAPDAAATPTPTTATPATVVVAPVIVAPAAQQANTTPVKTNSPTARGGGGNTGNN